MKTYKYKVQGVDYEVEIAEVEGKIAKVNVNGIPFEIEMQKPINAAKHPALAATKRAAATAPLSSSEAPLSSPEGDTTASAPKTSEAPSGAVGGAGGNAIKAPLPGTVSEIKVTVGQQVNVGDTVLVLEAMKMQNNIEAESAGTVKAIHVNKGDSVMEGAVLLTIG